MKKFIFLMFLLVSFVYADSEFSLGSDLDEYKILKKLEKELFEGSNPNNQKDPNNHHDSFKAPVLDEAKGEIGSIKVSVELEDGSTMNAFCDYQLCNNLAIKIWDDRYQSELGVVLGKVKSIHIKSWNRILTIDNPEDEKKTYSLWIPGIVTILTPSESFEGEMKNVDLLGLRLRINDASLVPPLVLRVPGKSEPLLSDMRSTRRIVFGFSENSANSSDLNDNQVESPQDMEGEDAPRG